MKAYKFIVEPEDGQLVLGVAYHVGREGQIAQLLAFAQNHTMMFEAEHDAIVPSSLKPIGYVTREE